MNKSKSQDSLYSESDSKDEEKNEAESMTESEEESESDVEVLKSVILREPPKISKFEVYGTKDVYEFFEEYEDYCREKYGENKKFWVNGLDDFLGEKLAEYYRIIVRERVIQSMIL